MAKNQEIFLILGCFGLNENDFISCLACENNILKINSSSEYYPEMMDCLDKYKLFDNPMLDSNGIRNFLSIFRDNFNRIDQILWSENKVKSIYKFINNHKECGLYLKLSFENKKIVIEEKPITINPVQSQLNFSDKIEKIKRLQKGIK